MNVLKAQCAQPIVKSSPSIETQELLFKAVCSVSSTFPFSCQIGLWKTNLAEGNLERRGSNKSKKKALTDSAKIALNLITPRAQSKSKTVSTRY